MRLRPTGNVEIDIGVLVYSNEVLWEFRNYLIGLEAQAEYKISMLLAKDKETILRVMSCIPGGFDIIVVAERLPGAACHILLEAGLKSNNDLKILCQSDSQMEEVVESGVNPRILFANNRDQLKLLVKENIDLLIAEQISK